MTDKDYVQEYVQEVTGAAAIEMAEKLGLQRRSNVSDLRSGQMVIIASSQGIKVGRLSSVLTEGSNVSSETYFLNNEVLFEERYHITYQDWTQFENRHRSPDADWNARHPATIESALPEGAVIYA